MCQDDLYQVMADLKFIALIKEDEKINVNSRQIQPKNFITPFIRMIRQDNRGNTFNFFSSTINKAFDTIGNTSSPYYVEDTHKNLLIDIVKAISGIKATQITYSFDRMFVCQLQTLIQYIESKLAESKIVYPDLFLEPTPPIEIIQKNKNVKNATKAMSL